jgi:type I restriction enzyme, S subunit
LRECWFQKKAGGFLPEAKVPVGYKISEVGVIPEEWHVSSVGNEFDIQLGKMLDAEKNFGLPKPYLGNKSVQWNKIIVSELPMMKLSKSDLVRFRVNSGDLLVCEGGEVGRAAIWHNQIQECYYQKALHRLRPKRTYDPRLMLSFLFRWVNNGSLSDYITQTSIAHLPKEKFSTIPLPVPSIHEQLAIATALSDIDSLLAGLDQLIAKKRALKQAAMQQLLTGQTRLPGFIVEWEEKPLGELFEFKNGLNKGAEFFGFGTPIVNYMDVFQKEAVYSGGLKGRVSVNPSELKTFDVRKGDVLFTRTSETANEVGMAAVVHDDVVDTVFSGFLLRARPKNNLLCNEYKAFCFSATSIRSQIISKASYTTRALTNGRTLSAIQMQIPPLGEQRAIALSLSEMNDEIIALEKRRDKSLLLKQGMMQQLLTGRIRLVPPAVPHQPKPRPQPVP